MKNEIEKNNIGKDDNNFCFIYNGNYWEFFPDIDECVKQYAAACLGCEIDKIDEYENYIRMESFRMDIHASFYTLEGWAEFNEFLEYE